MPPPPGLRFVNGEVPNWMQPSYLEVSQNLITPPNLVNNPLNHPYKGFHTVSNNPNINFNAWCSPTAAACQLGHLDNYGIFPPGTLSIPIGLDPSGFGDHINAGINKPNAIDTIIWDTARYFGDNILDGPNNRLPIGLMHSNQTSDFGWCMNTNNLGMLGMGVPPMKGTKIQYIFEGLDYFYGTSGIKDMISLTYHQVNAPNPSLNPPIYPVPPSMGRYYPQYWINNGFTDGSGSNYDPGSTLSTIEYEVSYNRTVIACLKGWNPISAGLADIQFTNTPEDNSPGKVYKFGAQQNLNEDTGEEYTDHDHEDNKNNPENPERISQSLGHTVLIIGFIKHNSSANPLPGQGINWLIVRDNQNNTGRNVVVPFNNSLGAPGGSLWDNLLATIYVNPMLHNNNGSPPQLLVNYWKYGVGIGNTASASAASNASKNGVNKNTISIAEQTNITSTNDIIDLGDIIKNNIKHAPNVYTKRNRRHAILDMIFANPNNTSKNEFKTKTADLALTSIRPGVTTKTNVNVFKKNQTININTSLTSDTAVYANLDTSGDYVVLQNAQSQSVTVTQNISGEYDVTGAHTGNYKNGDIALIIGYNVEFGSVYINGDGGSGTSNGDPHIYPIYGKAYELPNKVTSYRMLQGDKLIVNASTRPVTPSESKEILSYYQATSQKNPPKNLVTSGVFYNKVYIKADGNSCIYDFDTNNFNILQHTGNYFFIEFSTPDKNEFSKEAQNGDCQRASLTFNHSVYGLVYLNLDHFDNPQLQCGVGVTINDTTNLSGLLVREYKCKSMECRKLKNTKKIECKSIVGKNKSLMYFG